MPWADPSTYAFTEASVILNAPERSGVYAFHGAHVLHRWQACIYIGETKNIQAQLIHHLREDDPCFAMFRGLAFSYELVAAAARSLRWSELVREFRPICQRWA